MLSNKQITMSLGLGIALVFISALPTAWKSLTQVINKQVTANIQLVEWKSTYEALLPVNERFESAYPSASDAQDLVSLYRLFNIEKHNLFADIDQIRHTSSNIVEVNGIALGLHRICISNGSDLMTIHSSSVSELRKGLRGLSQRSDIEIGGVEVFFKDGKAYGALKSFCLNVRSQVGEV